MVGSGSVSGFSKVSLFLKVWSFLVLFASLLSAQIAPSGAALPPQIPDSAHPALMAERIPGTIDIRAARVAQVFVSADFEEDTQAPPRHGAPLPAPSYAIDETVMALTLPIARRKGCLARAPPTLA